MTTPEQSDEACAREVHAATMGESLRGDLPQLPTLWDYLPGPTKRALILAARLSREREAARHRRAQVKSCITSTMSPIT